MKDCQTLQSPGKELPLQPHLTLGNTEWQGTPDYRDFPPVRTRILLMRVLKSSVLPTGPPSHTGHLSPSTDSGRRCNSVRRPASSLEHRGSHRAKLARASQVPTSGAHHRRPRGPGRGPRGRSGPRRTAAAPRPSPRAGGLPAWDMGAVRSPAPSLYRTTAEAFLRAAANTFSLKVQPRAPPARPRARRPPAARHEEASAGLATLGRGPPRAGRPPGPARPPWASCRRSGRSPRRSSRSGWSAAHVLVLTTAENHSRARPRAPGAHRASASSAARRGPGRRRHAMDAPPG